MKQRKSEKSYTVSVILAGVFGVVGIHHFYLGRWVEGLFDLILSALWVYYIFQGKFVMFALFLGLDLIHSWIVLVMLLIGSFKDGHGAIVCYPGQKLK